MYDFFTQFSDLSSAASFHSSFSCCVGFAVSDIANLPGWASAHRMLPPCWQLAWKGFCAADLVKKLEKSAKINVPLPPLSMCGSKQVGFCLCHCTKGPFSPPVPRLFPHCSHCSSLWIPFKGQIGVTKCPLLFKGVVAAYIKDSNSLKP